MRVNEDEDYERVKRQKTAALRRVHELRATLETVLNALDPMTPTPIQRERQRIVDEARAVLRNDG